VNQPNSIHDPVTPEQSKYLSAFYWNTRSIVTAADIRKRQKEQAKNSRQTEKRRQERAAGRRRTI
jgi:hypothetical protein